MTLRRLDAGSIAGALGGVALVVSLFLDWYSPSVSGFAAFEALDLVLVAIGLLGFGAGVGSVLSGESHGGFGRAAPVAGVFAVVIVTSQALGHPPSAIGADAMSGQWIALAAAGVMAAGFGLGAARLSVSIDVTGGDRRGGGERRRKPDRRDRPVAPLRPVAGPPAKSAPKRKPKIANAPEEARAAEPSAMAELYPEKERSGPIGSNDPALADDRQA